MFADDYERGNANCGEARYGVGVVAEGFHASENAVERLRRTDPSHFRDDLRFRCPRQIAQRSRDHVLDHFRGRQRRGTRKHFVADRLHRGIVGFGLGVDQH